jgi:hypothetical protein
MPSHQIRIQQNNCDHEWKSTYGIDVADNVHDAKICVKCKKIIDLGHADFPLWHNGTADLSQIQQNIKDLLK